MVIGITHWSGTLKGIPHRMVGPIHLFVRILPLELHAVQIADMLHIGRVGAENPRVDRRFTTEHLHFKHQILVRILEVWKCVMWLDTIVSPHDSVLLHHRKLEESRGGRHRILARHSGTSPISAIPPVMECTTYLSIDEIPNREISPHVRTICTHHMGLTGRIAEHDHPTVEKIKSPYEIGRGCACKT